MERINIILKILQPEAVIYDNTTEKHIGSMDCDCIKIAYDEICNTSHNNEELDSVRRSMIDTDLL